MKRRSPKETEPDIDDPPLLWLVCPGLKYFYDFPVGNAHIGTFRLSADLTKKLGLEGPKIIAVQTTGCLEHGTMLLYCENDRYDIGRVIYDRFTDLFAIVKGDYDFVFRSDVEIVGEPLGYCDEEDINKETLRFRKI